MNAVAGTRPRVYFKKTTNANTYADNTSATDGWKFSEATNTTSPFTFTLDLSLLNGGLTGGETVQYFVVAQDLVATPNLGITSGVFASSPSSVS